MKGLRKLIPGRRGKDKRKDHAATTNKHYENPVDERSSTDKKTATMQKVIPETPVAGLETNPKAPIHSSIDPRLRQPNNKNGGDEKMDDQNIVRPASMKMERSLSCETTSSHFMIEDGPAVIKSYDAIPILEQTKLPRGGVSMETQAVGRVQFGIPPETIKDSMRLGLPVPAVYIVPVERFCREMGPALGVNLAEFEFPAYFNFFVSKKQCTLVVDSQDAESNIRRVFSETLLGPDQFRRKRNPIPFEEEDFDPDFPREAIPNFQKELEYFRIGPDGKELTLETLLNFRHFETPGETGIHENLGIPPPLENLNLNESSTEFHDSMSTRADDAESDNEGFNEEKLFDRDLKRMEQKSQWTYSQARWIGDVSTVWPSEATEEQIQSRTCKRIEIFKMPGGTEYILHDIDENNHIVGKAKFSGHVKVSESMSVDGFGGKSMLDDTNVDGELDYGIKEDYDDEDDDHDEDDDDDDDDDDDSDKLNKSQSLGRAVLPPTFHPPSFGVTVLGNSHGFDKSGSTSGYVLWINGRGVMIDPPPYSSATLEREGIRPRTIVGIILTHCHADHDAGAFQKVLTGSPVVVITTPTIYKSFIQKYSALSALSPALLMHSHRHKPAIIGSPLRFQGATFRFTYTLHSIPCVGFRVEWRGRSMVFTADHFNSPPAIEKLEHSGVLSKARADDLRNLPLQDTDLLLHEAGAPPIHTPLDVLMQLPQRVKRKLYVVHTSALPDDCDLRVAPTGTAGTIRLDQGQNVNPQVNYMYMNKATVSKRASINIEDDLFPSPWSSASNEYETSLNEESSSARLMDASFSIVGGGGGGGGRAGRKNRSNSLLAQTMDDTGNSPPLVSLRAASSTDAWFILNLLSAVPFLTSLSYASTMEVLETARVEAYCKDTVVVPSSRRNHVLCVVWEGTCVEREKGNGSDPRKRQDPSQMSSLIPIREQLDAGFGAVWHAGDWTGPISLQPEKRLSGDSPLQSTHDVVAMSLEGVKVITVEFSNLHAILKSGSSLYRKYLERRNQQRKNIMELGSGSSLRNSTAALLVDAKRNLNVLELLDCNSALRRLSAVQKRHLESLAEGPVSYQPGERLWRAGAPVDKAFVVVSGTASFVPKRRNAGSAGLPPKSKTHISVPKTDDASSSSTSNEFWVNNKSSSIGETMRLDAITAIRELKIPESGPSAEEPSENQVQKSKSNLQGEYVFNKQPSAHDVLSSPILDGDEFVKLSRVLQKDADSHGKLVDGTGNGDAEYGGHGLDLVEDESLQNLENICLDLENESINDSMNCSNGSVHARRRSSRARFANKVLGRLYNRRAFTGGLVFSRGHFLGDVSKMVAGRLSIDNESDFLPDSEEEKKRHRYGFGEKSDNSNSSTHATSDIIHEHEGDELVVHNSTLTAGKNGCVVLVFPKSTLCPFLDEYPGLLLSLLGTQVVV
mmetsp:Transcript_17577/g.26678  ORF Transcript_17577/g.26678 Transcript_17577/m.26678 type:complete len:1423 (+) Transcript_17577:418-4686(+)